jgi:hypothetical protein
MKVCRRDVLRGAGVALALPWLESLAPRLARGQASPARLRFVPVYFPLGTAPYWTPRTTGTGSSWQLSPILEPLAPLKQQVTVLSHVDNTTYGRQQLPNGPLLSGTFTTCTKIQANPPTNGISIDQLVANQLVAANGGKLPTPLHSLQVGLSTLDSYTDGYPPPFSRSITWKSPTEPLYKIVSPRAVFDRLVAAGLGTAPPPSPETARRAADKSVLDYVLGNAKSLQPRLSYTDRIRMDQFLSSVRALEVRTQMLPPDQVPAACVPLARPSEDYGIGHVPPDYGRDHHANLMIDLIVMALECDLTRVVSFMLDDAKSDFAYSFLQTRKFTATGSTPGTGPVGDLDSLAHTVQPNDAYATVNWWFVSKLAQLCQKMSAIPDGNGASLLDNSLVWFGSETRGGATWEPVNLPLLYVGGAGGRLKRDAHLDFFPSQSLSNVYLTFFQKVFGGVATSFGDSDGVVTDLLA